MVLLARIFAYLVAVGAVIAIGWSYDSLPAHIPLSRWGDIEKTSFTALRVPLINLISLFLIEVLLRPLARCEGFGNTRGLTITLCLTVAAKSLLEGMGLLLLPQPIDWTLVPLMGSLLLGLGIAAYHGQALWQNGLWRKLKTTKGENAVLILLIVSILGLNAPLIVKYMQWI